jgi:hypothetical protein
LIQEDLEDAPAPFVLAGRRVELPRSLVDETDPKVLDEFALTLAPEGTPLGRCTVLVAYTRHYAGVGRLGSRRSYYAFADLPARIDLEPGWSGDSMEYKPAEAELPFAIAVEAVRILPAGAKALELRAGADGALQAVVGDATQDVKADQTAKVCSEDRTIRVTEAPLTEADVEMVTPEGDPLPKPAHGDPNGMIEPGEDHGRIRFATTISVTYHGELPADVVETGPPGEPADDVSADEEGDE